MGRPFRNWSGFVSDNGVKVLGIVNGIGGAGIHRKWECLCPICKGVYQVQSKHIHKDMLGCSDCVHNMQEDIAGQKFGMLTAVRFDHSDDEGPWWLYRCECGCEKVLRKKTVKAGYIESCGCLASSMEAMVKKILTDNGVKYEEQKTFDDCRDKSLLRFDFYIPSLNLAVECQGGQHYFSVKFFGGDVAFEERKRRDQIKRDWCKEHGVTLLEIPYYEDVKLVVDQRILLPARMILY